MRTLLTLFILTGLVYNPVFSQTDNQPVKTKEDFESNKFSFRLQFCMIGLVAFGVKY